MIKAVIFDMDGVLIDSQPMHNQLDVDVLKEVGVKVTIDQLIPYAGTTNQCRFPMYQRDWHLDIDCEKIIKRREELLLKTLEEKGVPVVKGIPQLLICLKNHGVRTAIASSSSLAMIKKVLEITKLSSYFDKIQSGESLEKSKPAPDIFLKAAELLCVKPEDCIVIEDSHHGVLAGKRAGMKVLGYKNPTSGNQDISLADCMIDDFTKINETFFQDL